MDEILTEVVEEQQPEEIERHFATIGAVYEDGVSLIFDGEEEPTEKHYLCNTSAFFAAGDRVKILPDSGTYVVEYVVGSPKQNNEAYSVRNLGYPDYPLHMSMNEDRILYVGRGGGVTRYSLSGYGVKNLLNTNQDYNIYFRTDGNIFQIRMGSGSWFTLTTG